MVLANLVPDSSTAKIKTMKFSETQIWPVLRKFVPAKITNQYGMQNCLNLPFFILADYST